MLLIYNEEMKQYKPILMSIKIMRKYIYIYIYIQDIQEGYVCIILNSSFSFFFFHKTELIVQQKETQNKNKK